MQCTTCYSEVEPGRSHCRACDTPTGIIDPTTVMPAQPDPYAQAYGSTTPPPGWVPPPTAESPLGFPPPHGLPPPPGYVQQPYPPAPGHLAAPGYPPAPGHQQPPYPGAIPPGYGYPLGYGQQPMMSYPGVATPQKSKATAAVLCFFLGGLGIHRFYTGQTGLGVALLLTTLFLTWTIIWIPILFIWVMVDFVLILTGAVKDQHGRPLA